MEVCDLSPGTLFTLPCEGNHTIYVFIKNNEGGYSDVRAIAGWWPEGNRGKGEPAQWVYNDLGKSRCNPCAVVKLVT